MEAKKVVRNQAAYLRMMKRTSATAGLAADAHEKGSRDDELVTSVADVLAPLE
jgi:hypothetical protein